jgi:hypothetical protein
MSGLRQLSSAAAATIYDAISTATTSAELHNLSCLLWRGFGEGAICEDDASFLSDYIQRRRPARSTPASGQMTLPARPLPAPNLKRVSRIPKRKAQTPPDKQQAKERRHRLAASGVLPPHLASRLTTSDLAVMCIVKDEYRAKARCGLTLDEIAARAGVCRNTAKRAMQKARSENLISIEERPVHGKKHLPNLVHVISLEWLKWLRRPGNEEAKIGVHFCESTDNSLEDEDRRISPKSELASRESGQASKEAIEFAGELANIAGYRRTAIPESWQNADPPCVVQMWLNLLSEAGFSTQSSLGVLQKIATLVMRRKPDQLPPYSPRYFSAEIRRTVERRRRPVRVANVA